MLDSNGEQLTEVHTQCPVRANGQSRPLFRNIPSCGGERGSYYLRKLKRLGKDREFQEWQVIPRPGLKASKSCWGGETLHGATCRLCSFWQQLTDHHHPGWAGRLAKRLPLNHPCPRENSHPSCLIYLCIHMRTSACGCPWRTSVGFGSLELVLWALVSCLTRALGSELRFSGRTLCTYTPEPSLQTSSCQWHQWAHSCAKPDLVK